MASLPTMRMTRQRAVILQELRKTCSHPTADELFRRVRRRLPRISMGTVYRNLELMSQAGMIRTLELAGAQKRFDGCIQGHYHVRCLYCSCVEDLPTSQKYDFEKDLQNTTNYELVGHRLELVGICPRCKTRETGEIVGGWNLEKSKGAGGES